MSQHGFVSVISSIYLKY